ncbi:MAG: hypothetical protein OXE49_13340 [Gemmatimonadetes bacterium]|nr:hypothetical protein [Gemmatimonadota bacterium]
MDDVTDISEHDLERLICTALTGHPRDLLLSSTVGEPLPATAESAGSAEDKELVST